MMEDEGSMTGTDGSGSSLVAGPFPPALATTAYTELPTNIHIIMYTINSSYSPKRLIEFDIG